MSNKNEVFEYLIDQLRQQVSSNTYKQQCEDLAHEVQSLKNQLRDASALVAELREDNIKKSEHISHLTGQVKGLTKQLAEATGDVEAYKLIREQEQSGCRKDDTQECEHEWLHSKHKTGFVCFNCGARKEDTQECHHNWRFVNGKAPAVCINCGVTKSSECEHEWQFYGVGFPCMCIKCGLKKWPASYLSGYCPRARCNSRQQKRFTRWRRASQPHAPRRTRTSCFRATSLTIQRYALSAHPSDLVNGRSDYGAEI